MTSTISDEVKSSSYSSDLEKQDREKQIKKFEYPSMPKRNPLSNNNSLKSIKIACNLFKLEFKDIYHNLTLFDIKVKPPFEENNNFLRRLIYNYIETNFPKNFKKNFFGGNVLYSFINCEDDKSIETIEFKEKIKEIEYSITLTKIKQVEFNLVNDFNRENQKIKQYTETLIRNIIMKNQNVIYFKDRMLFEIDRKNILDFTNDNNEKIYRGYMTSANITESGLFFLINNINKVISGKTVLQKIKELEKKYDCPSKKEVMNKINEYFQNHKTVLTTYGVPRTYQIQEIDFDLNPQKFDITIIDNTQPDKKKTTVNFCNYYKTQYNIDIKNKEQPLILAKPKKRKKKSEQKNDVKEQEEEYKIYLLPELLYITGNEDDDNINKKNRERNLKTKTRINPDKKMELINGFIKLYNSTNNKIIKKGMKNISLKSPKELAQEWGIKLGNNLTFEGRIIPSPKINFNDQNNIDIDARDSLNGLFKPGSPIKAKDLTEKNFFVIFDSNDKKTNYRDILFKLCDKFKSKGFNNINKQNVQGFGLKNTYKWESIEEELKKLPIYNNQDKLGIIFCNNILEKYYEKLKEYFVKKCNIPTQHILTKNLMEKPKEFNSILFNLVDQINVKLGGMNYYIDFKKEKVIGQNDKFLVIGLDSKKYKNSITYSMTSSYHPKLNLFLTQEKTVNKKPKEEKANAIKSMFEKSLEALKNICPDYIIIYRQGGNEFCNKGLAVDELDIFKDVLIKLRESNKQNEDCNYSNTKLYYICCNLKSDLKFFQEEENSKYKNPLSGLIIDQYITQKNKFEFYLQPQYVNQGTATPSHYEVMYYDEKNNNLNIENLERLTYYLTYYYWTWHGAIRIPAILKFSTTALDFYSRCFNKDKELEEYKFDYPYYI